MGIGPARKQNLIVLLLCGVAALRVLVFSSAFPFFNNVDERSHFDLVVKYSDGNVPSGLDRYGPESARLIARYESPEFLYAPEAWHRTVPERVLEISDLVNHESVEPPLYYTVAGLWLRLGQACGIRDGFLLYWIRFLNALTAALLVWIGFAVARAVLPDEPVQRLGVPIFLAVFPQDSFYAIQSDTFSPVFFGLAFLGLVRCLGSEAPPGRIAALTGLALAASLLVKWSNAPLVAVAVVAVLFRARTLAREGRSRPAFPALLLFLSCAALPVAAWLVRNEVVLGSLTGTALKIEALGWKLKPLSDWGNHPIFSPHGLFLFGWTLLVTFWRGEFTWHGQSLSLPSADLFYALSSLLFPALAGLALLRGRDPVPRPRRLALCLAFSPLAAAIAFFAILSLRFDFGSNTYPSRGFPFFASGRLLGGALVPFLVLYVYGLASALRVLRSPRLRMAVLLCIAGGMGLSEIAVNRVAFASAYNFFHLQGNQDSFEAHYSLGLALAKQGKLDEAVRQYSEALRIRPDIAAYNDLGAALSLLGKQDEAIVSYGEAIRIKPDYYDAYNNLGLALAGAGRVEEAIARYTDAIRIKPDGFEAHFNLGGALARTGKLEGAIEHYRRAVAIQPDHGPAHANLGLALAMRGMMDEAAAQFSEGLRVSPQDALLHYNLGVAYEKMGRSKEAAVEFKAALEIKPDFAEAGKKLEAQSGVRPGEGP